jgi:pyruvate kinase
MMISATPLTLHKTKIVCTLGPTSNSYKAIKLLAMAGMNVVRLNFSYGSYSDFAKVIHDVRRVERELNTPIGILQDLQGPKIRLGKLKQLLQVNVGDRVLFNAAVEDERSIPIVYPQLKKDLRRGTQIVIGDGAMLFHVEKIDSRGVHARALSAGLLKSYQGVHFPKIQLHISAPTRKDLKDFDFGLQAGVDFVALSFVKSAKDIEKLRDRIKKIKNPPQIISKIERMEAIESLDSILQASDGAIVARGDLGIDVGLEDVPLLQKKIIQRSAYFGKYVITATQMLESMIEKERPTRAEVSDVANAVLDGTDAVLLSGETAAGRFPVQTVQMMSKILLKTEGSLQTLAEGVGLGSHQSRGAFAMAQAALDISEQMQIDRIVPFTYSGSTALRISKVRPRAWIVAMTPKNETWRKMSIYWGVQPILTRMVKDTDEMFKLAEDEFKQRRRVGNSKSIVLIAGIPLKRTGITNLLKVHEL